MQGSVREVTDLAPDEVAATSGRVASLVGVAGWLVILAGATAWEILSLVDPSISTLSDHVRVLMNPPLGRAALLIAWIAMGFALFGPR